WRRCPSAPATSPPPTASSRSASTPTTSTSTWASWPRTKTCPATSSKRPAASVATRRRLRHGPQPGALHAHPHRDQAAQGVQNPGAALRRTALPAQRRIPARAFAVGRGPGPRQPGPAVRQAAGGADRHRADRQLRPQADLRRRPRQRPVQLGLPAPAGHPPGRTLAGLPAATERRGPLARPRRVGRAPDALTPVPGPPPDPCPRSARPRRAPLARAAIQRKNPSKTGNGANVAYTPDAVWPGSIPPGHFPPTLTPQSGSHGILASGDGASFR